MWIPNWYLIVNLNDIFIPVYFDVVVIHCLYNFRRDICICNVYFTTFHFVCSSVIISDPTDDEESLATGVMTIVVTSQGKLCSVHKPGYTLTFVFITNSKLVYYRRTYTLKYVKNTSKYVKNSPGASFCQHTFRYFIRR